MPGNKLEYALLALDAPKSVPGDAANWSDDLTAENESSCCFCSCGCSMAASVACDTRDGVFLVNSIMRNDIFGLHHFHSIHDPS